MILLPVTKLFEFGIKTYTNKKKGKKFLIKAVLKCPLTEAKLSYVILKLIFQKYMKIRCMIIKMKICLMIFCIFLSVL